MAASERVQAARMNKRKRRAKKNAHAKKYREKIYSNKNRTLPHYRMDSFQLFLIKTLVGMSNRGVVGMLCTMDMHRLYIRSNNTNSQCKYDARTNFYLIFFFASFHSLSLSLPDFLSTEKLRARKKKKTHHHTHTYAFVLIKRARGERYMHFYIFAE